MEARNTNKSKEVNVETDRVRIRDEGVIKHIA